MGTGENTLADQHPLVLGCVVTLILIYVIGLFLGSDGSGPTAPGKLGLATGSTLIVNTHVWNVVTACFFETQVFKVFIDIAATLIVARGLETAGGLDQFALYIVFSILASTVGTSAYCFIRFFATGLEEMLMEPIYGFSGVFMAILMYARRQQKGAPIHYTVPQITYQNLPILVILGQTLLRTFGLTVFAIDTPFSIISLLFSWSYLRFFYRYDDAAVGSSSLGDKSEEFAFIAMFPEALHVVVIPLTTAFYNLMAMFGIFPELQTVVEKKPQHHLYQTANSKLPPDSPLIAPMRQDVVMERRRAKALKLLEMAEQNSSSQSNNWDMDEETTPALPTNSSSEFSNLKV